MDALPVWVAVEDSAWASPKAGYHFRNRSDEEREGVGRALTSARTRPAVGGPATAPAVVSSNQVASLSISLGP